MTAGENSRLPDLPRLNGACGNNSACVDALLARITSGTGIAMMLGKSEEVEQEPEAAEWNEDVELLCLKQNTLFFMRRNQFLEAVGENTNRQKNRQRRQQQQQLQPPPQQQRQHLQPQSKRERPTLLQCVPRGPQFVGAAADPQQWIAEALKLQLRDELMAKVQAELELLRTEWAQHLVSCNCSNSNCGSTNNRPQEQAVSFQAEEEVTFSTVMPQQSFRRSADAAVRILRSTTKTAVNLQEKIRSTIHSGVDSSFGSSNAVNQAMGELEQEGSRCPCIMRHLTSCCAIGIILSMVSFCLWGVYKLLNPAGHTEVESKTVRLSATVSTELPKIAFQQVSKNNFSLNLHHCTIERGETGTKSCVAVRTSKCEMELNDHVRVAAQCMPPSVHIGGTYGDEVYQYVKVEMRLGQPSESATLGLLWEHHNSISSKMVMGQKYNMMAHRPESRELYFGRVVATEGNRLGLNQHESLENEELEEELLKKLVYMVKLNEYSYPLPLEQVTGAEESLCMQLYLRDARVERQDFYEVYSVFRLLEESGGLFTALELVAFLPLLLFSRVYPRVRRFVVDRGYTWRQTSHAS